MRTFHASWFQKYLLPGFVFQSVIIAGGYGTGREIVEYFLRYGTLGGLLGMLLVTTVIWSIILAVTFEFSRRFDAYDYRTFFKKLLGPFWPLFEVLYLLFLFIVLAVIGSAAGVLIRDNFGIPYVAGVIIMLSFVGFLTFKGSGLIENFLSVWSIVLYFTYAAFLTAAVVKFGPAIKENFASGTIKTGWFLGGFKYALYNLGVIPAVFFCLRHIQTRREAVSAGLISSFIGIVPGLLFYVAVAGQYPAALSQEIPAVYLLQKAGIPALLVIFQIVLFGTLIETGTGFIHSVNERINAALRERGKKLHKWQRPLTAVILLLIGLGLSTFGLITLIAKGYGSISWGFLIVYIIPLITYGLIQIKRR